MPRGYARDVEKLFYICMEEATKEESCPTPNAVSLCFAKVTASPCTVKQLSTQQSCICGEYDRDQTVLANRSPEYHAENNPPYAQCIRRINFLWMSRDMWPDSERRKPACGSQQGASSGAMIVRFTWRSMHRLIMKQTISAIGYASQIRSRLCVNRESSAAAGTSTSSCLDSERNML